ncbi:molybdopterin biosynthesis protein [Pedobacter yonginense]|uniref:Molybdopterin-synthase adenylyltransferase n=1 Tax=Pedobacter yonginense TaxID=651869 RepID=A0A317EIS3_9SPHI|nr:HesA/MoeB/ThiF family protein [Pedobacter yonginense]PWS26027.1 molybdopterin biosynthesis protein [Pedobacter yonginense]
MDTERYNRQLILKGFGETAQQKLADAKVLIIGVGGLGCPALQYLVASGIGKIGMVDGDRVSLSNLHRQILFTTADVGKLKVEVASKRLNELNPQIGIEAYPNFITQTNALQIFSQYDLIIDGTDNFESRYLINDACALLQKPLIFAAVSGFEGQLAIFNIEDQNGVKTNYRDLFPIQPGKGEIPNCAENGILGVLPGIIGTMMATEAIKLITGIGEALINQILNYNLLNQQVYTITITPSPNNTYKLPSNQNEFLNMNYGSNVQSKAKQVVEIDIDEFENLQKKKSTLIIDVRETYEVPVLNLSDYKQVPMSVFESFLNQDIEQENIVLLCQHGIRSLAAAEELHEKYGDKKHIYSLKGGVIRWKKYFTTTP